MQFAYKLPINIPMDDLESNVGNRTIFLHNLRYMLDRFVRPQGKYFMLLGKVVIVCLVAKKD